QARRNVRKELAAPILGSDVRGDAITFAVGNAKAAGVGHLVRFELKDVRGFAPPDGPPGVLLCNPPYGERIGEEQDLRALYRTLGEVCHSRCSGWTAFVFTGNAGLARYIDLPVKAAIPLFNGKLPCKLLKYVLS